MPNIKQISDEELNNRFDFHPPKVGQAEAYAGIRQSVKTLAVYLNGALPEGREKHLAFTYLEQVLAISNSAIARRT